MKDLAGYIVINARSNKSPVSIQPTLQQAEKRAWLLSRANLEVLYYISPVYIGKGYSSTKAEIETDEIHPDRVQAYVNGELDE